MYGSMGDAGPIWDVLSSWISSTHVLGGVLLGLFLVLHVVIVSLVVRPMNGSDRGVAPRNTRVRRPSDSALMLRRMIGW